MVRPHAACCLKRLEPSGGIPKVNKYQKGQLSSVLFIKYIHEQFELVFINTPGVLPQMRRLREVGADQKFRRRVNGNIKNLFVGQQVFKITRSFRVNQNTSVNGYRQTQKLCLTVSWRL